VCEHGDIDHDYWRCFVCCHAQPICDGDQVAFILNGVQINGGHDSTYREGKILFQSEGAELFCRRIELHPVK
jgi:hypothetical protein